MENKCILEKFWAEHKTEKAMVGKIVDWTFANPFHQERFVVDGFAFHVYWDTTLGGFFRVGMFFNPNWPHSTGFSCRTKDDVFLFMADMILDARKIYKNGGKYPSNYYDKK